MWRSVVTAETSAGGSVRSQPLNDESTVEAFARIDRSMTTTNASFYTDVAVDIDAAVAGVRGDL